MSLFNKHKWLERNAIVMLIGIILVVAIGGLVEVVPLFRMQTVIEPVKGMRPYTPLELAGFDIYIREGCYNCHSQQIRPLRDEVTRYGHYSLAAESMYDHPFQWSSKRTGPDLARVGGKYSDAWHVAHLADPRVVVPESIMPTYSFLKTRAVNVDRLDRHLVAQRRVGVPYTDDMIASARLDALVQAAGAGEGADIAGLTTRYGEKVNIRDFDGNPHLVSEMDALVAYLQVLGTMVDFTAQDTAPRPATTGGAP